jgi:hypothetical protein
MIKIFYWSRFGGGVHIARYLCQKRWEKAIRTRSL